MTESAGLVIMGLIAALTLTLAGLVGGIIVDNGWRSDCEKIGAHVTGQKAYDCKERAK